MPTFTPPARLEASSDPFFGRYSIPVGQSVVKVNDHYELMPYPWLGTIASLTAGVDYFLGGHVYDVSDTVASALRADGFDVEGPTDPPEYGAGQFGEGAFGA